MKKLFLGSIALLTFSFSIVIFQISCKKEAVAQTTNYVLPPATTSTLGGIIVGAGLSVSSNGTLSVNSTTNNGVQQLNKIVYDKYFEIPNGGSYYEIWTANYDGSNQQKVNISLPTGFAITAQGDARLSPDGQTLFFKVWEKNANKAHIYKCNINGSNPQKIIDGTGTELSIGGAY